MVCVCFTTNSIPIQALPLLAEPAPAQAGGVGVLNVLFIRLRRLLLAAAVSSLNWKWNYNVYCHSRMVLAGIQKQIRQDKRLARTKTIYVAHFL
ncbi:MAG: hypothetical protein APR62_10855 [Smithella sp. SDB]|nr:MAG: hypothetical protein APR62_10855 [Smithella sp. SDB]